MIVLVPAYEPDERLLELVDDLPAADPDLRLVVVDDGSGPPGGCSTPPGPGAAWC